MVNSLFLTTLFLSLIDNNFMLADDLTNVMKYTFVDCVQYITCHLGGAFSKHVRQTSTNDQISKVIVFIKNNLFNHHGNIFLLKEWCHISMFKQSINLSVHVIEKQHLCFNSDAKYVAIIFSFQFNITQKSIVKIAMHTYVSSHKFSF